MENTGIDFWVAPKGIVIDVRGLYGYRYFSLLRRRPWNAIVSLSSAAEEQLPARSGGMHMGRSDGTKPARPISLPRS